MITVNHHHRLPWHAGMTVRDVLRAMHYTFPHIVVTVNGKLVRHDTYDETEVPEGADVRAVHLLAGG